MSNSSSAGERPARNNPRRGRTLLALSAIGGEIAALETVLVGQLDGGVAAGAIAGDLGAPSSDWATYRGIFTTRGSTGKPTFWVPGLVLPAAMGGEVVAGERPDEML